MLNCQCGTCICMVLLGKGDSSLMLAQLDTSGAIAARHSVLTCNYCTKCVGSLRMIHDRTPDCNLVSREWFHG